MLTNPTLLPLICSLFAIVCIIIEAVITSDIEWTSSELAEWLQKGRSSGLDWIFLIISPSVIYLLLASGLVVYSSFSLRLGSLGITCEILAIWIGDVMKLHYKHPRPFWNYSDVDGIECAKDWGAPSGHAFLSAAVIFFYLGEWIRNRKGTIWKFLLCILIVFIIDIDRVYLGVHFYFQVTLGNCLGILLALTFRHLKVQELVLKIGENWKFLIAAEIACGSFLLWTGFLYLFSSSNWEEKWTINFFASCEGTLNFNTPMFAGVLESTIILMLAGFWIGKYYLKIVPYKTTKKTAILGFALLLLGAGVDQGIEQGIIKYVSETVSFIVYCILRFLAGLYIGFVIPRVVSRYYIKHEKEYVQTAKNEVEDINRDNEKISEIEDPTERKSPDDGESRDPEI